VFIHAILVFKFIKYYMTSNVALGFVVIRGWNVYFRGVNQRIGSYWSWNVQLWV